jgi:hypothetical protein
MSPRKNAKSNKVQRLSWLPDSVIGGHLSHKDGMGPGVACTASILPAFADGAGIAVMRQQRCCGRGVKLRPREQLQTSGLL